MPNYFAYIILFSWPLISVLLFKRYKCSEAVVMNVVVGFLVMPVGVSVDLPFIPPLDKESIIAITTFLGAKATYQGKLSLLPTNSVARILLILLLAIPLINVITNTEPTFNGQKWIQSLSFYDGISAVLDRYISLLPFIVGIQTLKTDDEKLFLFKTIVLGAIFYSALILFEIRMSPQLHNWIYGFFPHSFAQQVRFGGFRAVVFLGHGLTVSMFLFISIASALILSVRNEIIIGFKASYIVLYLLLVLFMSKSVAPIIYSVLFIVIIKFLFSRTALITNTLMALVITYPLMSIFNIFPHDYLVEVAGMLSPDRAQSLSFRFFNEAILLEHALEKPLLGWGGWGRNLFYNSTIDGTWIIVIGVAGLLGFIGFYGLPLVSVLKASKAFKLCSTKASQTLIAAHGLLVAFIMLDQLPNSSMKGYIWLLIGSLLGSAIRLGQSEQSNIKNNGAI